MTELVTMLNGLGRWLLGVTAAWVAVLTVLGCLGLPTASERKAESQGKETAARQKESDNMDDSTLQLRYGFRHDPMKWVEQDESVQGALVRARVLGTSRPGDEEIIEARIAEVLKGQREDGSFGDTAKETGDRLARLACSGCGADRPDFRRAFDAMLRQVRDGRYGEPDAPDYVAENRLVPVNGLRGACMAGMTDSPEVRRTLRWLADHPDVWLEKTCPWGATFALRALWYGREAEDVDSGIDAALDWIGREMNDAACVRYWDPYAVVAAVGMVERPKARGILLRQLPMILRGQQADGGWGQDPEDQPSVGVFSALKTHDLLEKLRELPPLPPDWKVVRSIPAPEGNLGTMTWRDGVLWVHEWGEAELIAVSPEDDTVLKRLKIDGVFPSGVGRWGDGLAITQGDPKRVLKVNADTGGIEREIPLAFMANVMSATEVGGKLWVADGWFFPGNVVDPEDPSTWQGEKADELPRLEPHLAGTCPNGFAVCGDGVWHTDFFARAMIKSGPGGKLLDWAERPFGWTSGIAWDGEDLWAINGGTRQISLIRKTATAPVTVAAGNVQRKEGNVLIEGVPTLSWGESSDTTFAGAMAAALAVTDHPCSATQIMGYSGLAFRVRWAAEPLSGQKGWCPSIPVGEFPEEQAAVVNATGWRFRIIDEMANEQDPRMGRYADEIAAAIDSGMPVVGYPDKDDLNVAVAYGYEGGGADRKFLWRTYWSGSEGKAVPAADTGPWVMIPLEYAGAPDGRQRLLDALRIAVRNWRRDGSESATGYQYTWGERALAGWQEDLRRAEEFTEEQRKGLFFVNWWNYEIWQDARGRAAAFLKDEAPLLEPVAREALLRAAELYGQEAKLLQAQLGKQEAFLGPWSGKGIDDWTRAVREREQQILAEGLGLERRAVAEIEAALDASGVEKPGPLAQSVGGRAPEAPERVVLEGVPKVAYHTDRWRFTPFCNALDACLQYLGEPEQYDYLMCTSGAAFRMTWTPKAWDGGNSDILGMAVETLEPMRRAFGSAGYEMVPVAKAEPAGWPEDILRDSAQRLGGELTDEAGFRRRIVASINAGRPVIAFGAIGPPEACVITGYDEGGDVLIGWNVFQDDEGAETEPSGYFRVRDWYAKTHALLVIGEEVRKPDPKELDREALKWAVKVLRTPRVRKSHAGPAAFDAWAADMLNDEYFPGGNIGVLRARLMCHWDSMTVTATRGGGSATAYLLSAAEREPAMAEHLRAAADCLDHEDVVHGVAPGEEAQIARLADPAVRRQVADSILGARDMHVEAADHIEAALLAAGVPPDDIPRPEAAAEEPAGDRPGRVVLEGVPKVGFGMIDGHVGMTPFPACLRACLEYMGDDLGFGDGGGKYPRDAVYAYLMGTTGAAFRLDWKPGWHGDNVASWLLSDDPSEIFRRGFAAAGYEQIPSGHLPDGEKEERFRSMVVESIRDRGLPVIAHGVIGPPEEAIIAGYDEDGRVAIGWSFFQDREIGHAGVEFEPNGYFRKRRWEADTWSMMAIGDKVEMPARRDAYVDALQWAVRVMREPVRYGDRHNGLAAYDAWAEHILRDDEVAAGGGPDDAFIVHSDAADVVAEGRYYASVFLKQAADSLPEAKDELLAAAECCKAEHDLMWEIWGIVGSNVPSEETRREFLKPDVRRRIVPIIHQARDRDAEAAGHIEAALRALGVEVPQPPARSSRAAAAGSVRREGGRTWIEGLERFPAWMTQAGGYVACSRYLGFGHSPAWIQGATGFAFVLNVHEALCPSGPTAWHDEHCNGLARNLGLEIESMVAFKEAGDLAGQQKASFQRAREAIDAGLPIIGWEMDIPEYYVVCGYDEEGNYLFRDLDGRMRSVHHSKLGDTGIGVHYLMIVRRAEPADDRTTVRRAIEFALEVAGGGHGHGGKYATGLAGYDQWIAALEQPEAVLADENAGFGLGYNAACWAECRRHAAPFLDEAMRRLGDDELAEDFGDAINSYRMVAARLGDVAELFPFDSAQGPAMQERLRDESRRAQAAAALRAARAAEADGLRSLARIAVKLGSDAAAAESLAGVL